VSDPPARIPLGPHDEGRRLDRVLRKLLPDVPLGRIYALLRKGAVRVSGRRRSGSYRLAAGELIELPAELAGSAAAPARGAGESGRKLPAELAGRTVWENEHLLAVDKPAGMPVHGEEGLLAALRPYLGAGASKSAAFRPGPVHRLDRNTSGLILFPKTLPGARRASRLLHERLLAKGYLAVLSGHLDGSARWEDVLERDRRRGVTRAAEEAADQPSAVPSAGAERRRARTSLRALAWSAEATLALVRIETGRTHQIRAQAAAHGLPLLGDRKYGGGRRRTRGGGPAAADAGGPTYLLHAAVLLNTAPDEVFPAEALCAPPRAGLEAALRGLFGGDDFERVFDCEFLTGAVSALVYKDRGGE
jgi:23S rRNA pseudouridine955/2504/2580 synthase